MTPRATVRTIFAAMVAAALTAPSGQAEVLAYEVAVAEAEVGRVRNLVQRLNKQNVLYQLRLGSVQKADVVRTAEEIDRVLRTLEHGSTTQSIPAPWSPESRAHFAALDEAWGSLRALAVASPYDYLRKGAATDPMRLRYFDELALKVVSEASEVMKLYDEECRKSESALCRPASAAHFASMLSERAVREAVLVFAGIDVDENRKKLAKTLTIYEQGQKENNEDPFLHAALSPERGESGTFAAKLLASLRADWETIRRDLALVQAGKEADIDLNLVLDTQEKLAAKLDRFTAAMIRYANVKYGR